MKKITVATIRRSMNLLGVITLALGVAACSPDSTSTSGTDEAAAGQHVIAPGPGTTGGQWEFLGGDAAHTRYSPAEQINADNFEDLEEAWVWDGASFNAQSGRSTPSYIDGTLYTVAGARRYVTAIDPATGELLWSYGEPKTGRYEYSMRKDYGKGVAYANVDGRGVIYISSPAFFLTALDAKTGQPLENWGTPVPIDGFPESGVVDMLADLGHEYDPYDGLPLETGYITTSSPPIVVNGVIIVSNSHEQGYYQSRIENVPGDILAYDARTGKFLWKFNVIPQPGEFGHDTWENDAWKTTGDISSWAPMSADLERGIVYIPTNGVTIDYYGGFSPGDNLFSTSLIALDAKTGKRVWHYQLVHHDIWNYDTPTAPVLLDVTIDGKKTPIVVQTAKQNFAYTFNRETGEPIWPIEEKPVPASDIPGEKLSDTQPFPTRPAAYGMQGLVEDDLIDYTPELRAAAIEALKNHKIGPLFNPPLHRDNDQGYRAAYWCPGDGGGTNIDGPTVADPETGILYVSTKKACSSRIIVSGAERDKNIEAPTGITFADYASLRSDQVRGPFDLPLFKPPYSHITAIDMNTGDILWKLPVGETPERYTDNPKLKGVKLPATTGTGRNAVMAVTKTVLMYASTAADGTPMLFFVNKKTGEPLGGVEVENRSNYGMMTYMHQGKQYIVLQTGPKLTALALYDESEGAAAAH
ncbi:MAG: PQQ-binding-like beta-propeller repeat protein [Gammaproteobacteria bacterium]|nr:PQQ-binding-like beta-propeller repeat protein [Gammaproteobacteria bacterium]